MFYVQYYHIAAQGGNIGHLCGDILSFDVD